MYSGIGPTKAELTNDFTLFMDHHSKITEYLIDIENITLQHRYKKNNRVVGCLLNCKDDNKNKKSPQIGS